MALPRIYADFNGIGPSPRRPERLAVPLDVQGTFAALARAGISLREGLELTIWDASDEAEDLEADTVVYREPTSGMWLAECDAQGYRYVPAGLREF